MSYLTREQILDADDVQYQEVECKEWGGTVLIRSLSGSERDAFEAESLVQKGKSSQVNLRNVRARLAARCIVGERGGKPIFNPVDVDALGKKSAAALDRVFSAAMELSGLTPADVKELVENFDDAQSEDSGSA